MVMVCVYIFSSYFQYFIYLSSAPLCMCSTSDELAEVYLPLQEIDADEAPAR